MINNLDELKYEEGYPTVNTFQKLYDQLDMQRAVQAYLDFMPAMSKKLGVACSSRNYRVRESGSASCQVLKIRSYRL
jgi:hypothetical protein